MCIWRRILRESAIINTAQEFAEEAKIACPNVNIIFVPTTDVAKVKKELEGSWVEINLKPFSRDQVLSSLLSIICYNTVCGQLQPIFQVFIPKTNYFQFSSQFQESPALHQMHLTNSQQHSLPTLHQIPLKLNSTMP